MGKDFKKGRFAFIIIVAIAIGCSVMSMVENKSTSTDANEKTQSETTNPISISKNFSFASNSSKDKFPSKPYIAKIIIQGVIQQQNDFYNQEWLLEKIEELSKDSNNKGIMLWINSPGGGVYEADEIYLALMDYKKKTERPVYAYFGPLAASGGYYIGCAADYISANRNCMTGSIGVIAGQFVDLTGLMEKYGVKITTTHAGKNKIMGHFSEPATEEQKMIMQSIADECYEQFTAIVSDSRKMDIAKVKSLADGRIYTAKQAKENGLIDNISSFEDAEKIMELKEFNSEDYEMHEVKYEKAESVYKMLMGTMKDFRKASSKSELPNVIEETIKPQVPFPAYISNY